MSDGKEAPKAREETEEWFSLAEAQVRDLDDAYNHTVELGKPDYDILHELAKIHIYIVEKCEQAPADIEAKIPSCQKDAIKEHLAKARNGFLEIELYLDEEYAKKEKNPNYRVKAAEDMQPFNIWFELGLVFEKLGDPLAIEYFTRVGLNKGEKSGNTKEERYANFRVGVFFYNNDRYQDALGFFIRSLNFKPGAPLKPNPKHFRSTELFTMNSLLLGGDCLSATGNMEATKESLAWYRTALQLTRPPYVKKRTKYEADLVRKTTTEYLSNIAYCCSAEEALSGENYKKEPYRTDDDLKNVVDEKLHNRSLYELGRQYYVNRKYHDASRIFNYLDLLKVNPKLKKRIRLRIAELPILDPMQDFSKSVFQFQQAPRLTNEEKANLSAECPDENEYRKLRNSYAQDRKCTQQNLAATAHTVMYRKTDEEWGDVLAKDPYTAKNIIELYNMYIAEYPNDNNIPFVKLDLASLKHLAGKRKQSLSDYIKLANDQSLTEGQLKIATEAAFDLAHLIYEKELENSFIKSQQSIKKDSKSNIWYPDISQQTKEDLIKTTELYQRYYPKGEYIPLSYADKGRVGLYKVREFLSKSDKRMDSLDKLPDKIRKDILEAHRNLIIAISQSKKIVIRTKSFDYLTSLYSDRKDWMGLKNAMEGLQRETDIRGLCSRIIEQRDVALANIYSGKGSSGRFQTDEEVTGRVDNILNEMKIKKYQSAALYTLAENLWKDKKYNNSIAVLQLITGDYEKNKEVKKEIDYSKEKEIPYALLNLSTHYKYVQDFNRWANIVIKYFETRSIYTNKFNEINKERRLIERDLVDACNVSYHKGSLSRFRRCYNAYKKSFKGGKYIEHLKYQLGNLYRSNGRLKKALYYYRSVKSSHRSAKIMADIASNRIKRGLFGSRKKLIIELEKLSKIAKSDSSEILLVKIDAKMELAEYYQERFESIKLNKTRQIQIKHLITSKIEAIQKATKLYLDITKLAVNNMNVYTLALFRIAEMQKAFCDAFLAAPVPTYLTDDQQAIYLEALEKQARPLEEEAFKTLSSIIEQAKKENFVGEGIEEAIKLKSIIAGKQYNSELPNIFPFETVLMGKPGTGTDSKLLAGGAEL